MRLRNGGRWVSSGPPGDCFGVSRSVVGGVFWRPIDDATLLVDLLSEDIKSPSKLVELLFAEIAGDVWSDNPITGELGRVKLFRDSGELGRDRLSFCLT